MMARETGILADRAISALFETGRLISERELDRDQIQPASLDLRLGAKAFRVRASFMPGPSHLVSDKLDRLSLHVIDLSEGAVLETGCVYIVPLMESLALPADMSASANPKSSTGRLDIFTRVITDYAQEFDKIPSGYSGPLYLEISPRTFPIVVRRGSRLSQIRFRVGQALLGEPELLKLHESETLVASKLPNVSGGGIALSIDLAGDKDGLIGYRGKHHTAVVDVDKKAEHDLFDFWEPLHSRGRNELILDPDEFYILVSREAVHVPPDYAAEMTPSIRWSANSASIMPASSIRASAMRLPAGAAAAPCSKSAATKCPSSSKTARSSAASSTNTCRKSPPASTAPASAPTTRRRA